jgi:hypothetical protein
MCEAEEELARAHRAAAALDDKLDQLVDRIADCERGIVTVAELHREALDIRRRSPHQAAIV